jgi:spermidine synthase
VALIDQGNGWRLTNNGLPESFIQPPDTLTPRSPANWLSMLPVLLRPEIRHMVIIGLGAGMTVSAVPSTLESIDVIELEPEVVAANRAVPDRAGGDPLADPRIALRLGDARGALTLSERRYDAIVSQPSHPWTSGASHLYTREFFQLAHSRLTPEGVFVQWIGAAFVDPERLRSLLAALTGVFRCVEVYRPVAQALVMVASDTPFDVAKSAERALAAAGADFEDEGIHRVEDVVAALAFDADTSREFADGTPPNSDDWNRLAMSERPAGRGRSTWVAEVFAPRDPLPAFADRLDLAVLARRLHTEGYGARGRRLAQQLDGPRRGLVLGWLAVDTQRPDRARQHFAAALDADPALRDAAIGLALVDPAADLSDLPDSAQAVIRALRDPEGLKLARANEERLAQWRPGDLLYPEAAELRVRWRLELGGEAELREAYQILAPLIERAVLPRYLLYRARVAARLGDPRVAWISLQALSTSDRASPPVAAEAVALAMELGAPAESKVVQRLQRAMSGRPNPAPAGTPAQS